MIAMSSPPVSNVLPQTSPTFPDIINLPSPSALPPPSLPQESESIIAGFPSHHVPYRPSLHTPTQQYSYLPEALPSPTLTPSYQSSATPVRHYESSIPTVSMHSALPIHTLPTQQDPPSLFAPIFNPTAHFGGFRPSQVTHTRSTSSSDSHYPWPWGPPVPNISSNFRGHQQGHQLLSSSFGQQPPLISWARHRQPLAPYPFQPLRYPFFPSPPADPVSVHRFPVPSQDLISGPFLPQRSFPGMYSGSVGELPPCLYSSVDEVAPRVQQARMQRSTSYSGPRMCYSGTSSAAGYYPPVVSHQTVFSHLPQPVVSSAQPRPIVSSCLTISSSQSIGSSHRAATPHPATTTISQVIASAKLSTSQTIQPAASTSQAVVLAQSAVSASRAVVSAQPAASTSRAIISAQPSTSASQAVVSASRAIVLAQPAASVSAQPAVAPFRPVTPPLPVTTVVKKSKILRPIPVYAKPRAPLLPPPPSSPQLPIPNPMTVRSTPAPKGKTPKAKTPKRGGGRRQPKKIQAPPPQASTTVADITMPSTTNQKLPAPPPQASTVTTPSTTDQKLPVPPPQASIGADTTVPISTNQKVEQPDRDVEIGEQIIEVVTDEPTINKERAAVQMYTNFVKYFQYHRSKLGYDLKNVIQQIAIRYGQKVSLEYITNFEELMLTEESYVPLLNLLDTWIKDTARAAGTSEEDIGCILTLPTTGIYPQRAKKKRTIANARITSKLEEEFAKKKTPTPNELQRIANYLRVGKDYVRIWFCNRRRREKCEGKRPMTRQLQAASYPTLAEPPITSPHSKIPSPLYDITIEVPSIHPRDIGLPTYTNYIHKVH